MIKRKLKFFLFTLHFSFKNITREKLQTLSLLVSLTLLNIILLIGILSSSFVQDYYYNKAYSQYGNTSIVLSTDGNDNQRFFSITPLLNEENKEDYFKSFASFFKIETLVSSQKVENEYATSFISNTKQLSYILNKDVTEELKNDEAIITSSFANNLLIEEGEYFSLFLGESQKEFKAIKIVEDKYMFSNNSFLINKSEHLSFFLETINPSFSSLNPALLENIYNKVYFTLQDDVSISEASDYLAGIEEYEELSIKSAINESKIQYVISRTLSLFGVVFYLILFFVLFLLFSTFLIYFDKRKKTLYISKLLGAKKGFLICFVFLEILFLFILSFLLAICFAFLIVNFGIIYVGSEFSFIFDISDVLISFFISFLIVFISFIFFFIRFFKKNKRIKRKLHPNVKYVFLLVLALASLIILYIFDFSFSFLPFLKIFLTLIFIFLLISFLINLTLLISKKKNHFYYFLNLKIFFSKPFFKGYNFILFICFVSIFTLFGARAYMSETIEDYISEVRVDYILFNTRHHRENILQEVDENDKVKSAHLVSVFSNITIDEYNHHFDFLISLDSNEIDQYFNLEIEEKQKEKLDNDQKLKIILPDKFRYLHGFEKNDYIEINFSSKFEKEQFKIKGFFEATNQNIAFFNINNFDKYEDISENAIFINEKEDVSLKNDLINSYSPLFVYVIDFSQRVESSGEDFRVMTSFLLYLTFIIISCIIFAIFNYSKILFDNLKVSFSRSIILGASRKKLFISIIIEQVITFFIILVSTFIMIFILNKEFVNIVIFFGEYENIYFSINTIFKATLLVFIFYILSKVSYLLKISFIKKSLFLNIPKD